MSRTLVHWRNRLPRPWDFPSDVETLVNQFLGSDGDSLTKGNHFAPVTNIVERETAFEVSVELPGIDPDEVKVEAHEGDLVISGEKKSETNEENKTFHRVERRYGEFRRIFSLPSDIDREKIDAGYNHGVLTVTLPKSEKVLPKQIEVKKLN